MKPGVFSQLYVHLIFSPKYRERLLIKEIRPELFSYMSGIVTNRKHKSIIINGVMDHVHILAGLNPDDKISDLVKNIKDSTSTFLNENRYFNGKFHWQEGYGAFSYGKSQVKTVFNYIADQENHHNRSTFREEYIGLLKLFEIEFDERYLFEFFD